MIDQRGELNEGISNIQKLWLHAQGQGVENLVGSDGGSLKRLFEG